MQIELPLEVAEVCRAYAEPNGYAPQSFALAQLTDALRFRIEQDRRRLIESTEYLPHD